jgi:ubiquinone/menaquinone biosynthesis C-methylase UbiE
MRSMNCPAAFKNFSEPLNALDEMHRILRAGGEALIADLRSDVSLDEIDAYVKQSGRGRVDAWVTRWIFRWVLVKLAYGKHEFIAMAEQSRFGTRRITTGPIGYEVRFAKPALGESH